MDEVRIWNVARTEDQILAHMYTELTGNESGLAAYWDFNDGPGSTIATDRSGNGNHGTLISGASSPLPQWVVSDAPVSPIPEPSAKPPRKPGNPGLPGCLAEVEQLRSQALVPQTGQTTCWDTSGLVIPCAGTGQDGEQQRGVQFSTASRYIVNGDGTVTDSLTGLEWLEDANCMATNYPEFDDTPVHSEAGDGAVTWQDALDFVKGINDGTFPLCSADKTGWRLPNIRELHSVIDYVDGTAPPVLNLPGVKWWSSTTRDQIPTTAFTDGGIFISSDGKHKDLYRVWPVRDAN
jgi:hypothetical protein